MGMFDYLYYKGDEYQTKDTPSQILDKYEIRDDGNLWHENYDAEWIDCDENSFGGLIEKSNVRWEPCNYSGIIRFYRSSDKHADDWEEYSATFSEGRMINLIEI